MKFSGITYVFSSIAGMASLSLHAQQPITYLGSVKKAQLALYQSLEQITREATVQSKSLLIEFTTKVGGRVVIVSCRTLQFSKEVLSVLKKADAGSKLFVDVILNGDRSKKRSYILMITNP